MLPVELNFSKKNKQLSTVFSVIYNLIATACESALEVTLFDELKIAKNKEKAKRRCLLIQLIKSSSVYNILLKG